MNRLVALGCILCCTASLLSQAAVTNTREQIAAVKQKITLEQDVNSELKVQLAAKETEVAGLKVKLKQIEDQIDALKKEHHLEAK